MSAARHSSYPDRLTDPIIGVLYGIAIGAMLLGIWRQGRTVASTPNNGSVSCAFTLPDLSTITAGPTNTVGLTCASPSGSGTDSKVAIHLAPGS
jgi:hypothetical protein